MIPLSFFLFSGTCLWVVKLFVGFRSMEKLLMFRIYYYITAICVLDRCICILVTVLCLYDSYIIIKNASSWVSNAINHPPEIKHAGTDNNN